MAILELIAAAKSLSPQEQRQLIAALRDEEYALAEKKFVEQFAGMTEIPIYTPFGCEEAAVALQQLLASGGKGELIESAQKEMLGADA